MKGIPRWVVRRGSSSRLKVFVIGRHDRPDTIGAAEHNSNPVSSTRMVPCATVAETPGKQARLPDLSDGKTKHPRLQDRSLRWAFAIPAMTEYDLPTSGEPSAAGEQPPTTRKSIMGDRSPKSVHKQATQKQSKASDAVRKKQEAVSAKQLGSKNR